ncbi:hypothetical protein L3Q82_005421 [Scortum barcoo]|uniref:Uncharacterized protein n=1 Tax=Scortum barcoo TaxID=214431 RepID=A0ACB8VAE0_9TELE|nr:hypothetical protein L3Q82_005421 [Scortum barcoo]
MVWGGISLGGRTALHVLARGSLTAIRYRDEILRPLVRPYAGAVGPGFLLMQDNARPHVAGVCQQFLQDEGIDAMDWPARSPDLNPIEHIWDIMSRSIHQRHVAPQTVQELADALVQVWEEIPQETICHLIRSMPRLTGSKMAPEDVDGGTADNATRVKTELTALHCHRLAMPHKENLALRASGGSFTPSHTITHVTLQTFSQSRDRPVVPTPLLPRFRARSPPTPPRTGGRGGQKQEAEHM